MKTLIMKIIMPLTLFMAGIVCAADPASILFIAAKDSHGWGEHEHHAGCDFLAKALNESGLNIKAAVHYDTWPEDKKIFDGIKAVVIFGDGDGGHIAKGHEKELQELSDKGIGIACIHYAVASDHEELNRTLLNCIGGFFEVNWSVNPTWTLKDVTLAKHPITSGVNPFELKDEWYYHMRFREGMKNVTPVLSALPPEDTLAKDDGPRCGNPALRKELKDGVLQHVAWAATSENGARGFGFTGGHFHTCWTQDDYRKLVLNAIVWCAGIDVPSDGVKSGKPVIVTNKTITQAIAKGDIEDIKRHIASGADLNEQNKSGWTSLHYAVVRGNTDAARLLIENGAKVDIVTGSGQTALHFAADRDFLELCKLLVDKGANIMATEKEGWTPLHYAAAKDRVDVAAFLLEKKADVNFASNGGGRPLHEAAASASAAMINLLLKNGADPSLKAKNGKTALDYAKELENKEAEKILSQAGTSAAVTENKVIRILLTYGGHAFEQEKFFTMFDNIPGIKYTKHDLIKNPDILKPGLEKDFDILVMYDMMNDKVFKDEYRKNFIDLLNTGIGLVSLHHNLGGNGGWSEYRNIIGGKYVRQNEEIEGRQYTPSGYSHGETLNVTIVDKEHPITKGVENFTIHDETYSKFFVTDKAHILMKTDHPKCNPEIAWTHKYGKSPVCYLMLGHDSKSWENPAFPKLLSNAINWVVSADK